MSQIKADKLFLLQKCLSYLEGVPFPCTLECRYISGCWIPWRTRKFLIHAHKQFSLCLQFSVSFYYVSQSQSWRLLFIVLPWHISRWADAVTLIWKNVTLCNYFWNGLGQSQIVVQSYSLQWPSHDCKTYMSLQITLYAWVYFAKAVIIIGTVESVSKWIVKPTKIQGYVR